MKMRNYMHSPVNSRPSTPPRTFSETIMEDNIQNAELIIRRWELTTSSSDIHISKTPQLFTDQETNRRDAQHFVKAVEDLKTSMHFYLKLDSSSEILIRAQNLMEIAMKILEREFYTILKANRSFLDAESVSHRSSASRASTWSVSSDFENEELASEDDNYDNETTQSEDNSDKSSEILMSNLKTIADCMISAGYGKECVYIYKLIRRSMTDETLYYLGVEKLSSSQIQKMDWNVLELKIKKWLTAVKTAVKTLFHGERILCDHVFSASDNIRESCFSEIVKDNALTLLSFPENVAKYKKILSPEKMFRFLDIYEAISDLWIEIEVIFSFDSLSVVKSQAVASLLKLGEAVRTMLSQFEAAIQRDSSKAAVPGGAVHPLTRYVMNYLVFLADYSGSVADIVSDWPMAAQSPLPESYFSSPVSTHGGMEEESPASTISARLAWLILVLLCKLDAKAGFYGEHVAQSYLFLANNLNYVVSKVRTSSLSLLMGSEWISKHELKVKNYTANYERMGWNKVIASVPSNPMADISILEVKNCFRNFNAGFEEAYRVQGSWVIPDSKLRDQVKISLARAIIPRYRVFYKKYREVLGRERQLEPIVRFAPEDLENYLSDLFFGNGSSGSTVTTATMSYISSSSSVTSI
ncbi:hypothetical protein M9H77_15960 [Catharanthus roseus]|uniref:Uncharacterized protein n=1 Tax=Catharanthus roseus TaxID=4058 RepID=A0ACC0B0W5_CATRO|nr:hypothetical protein M9H77_15960 [Catharanthus roseus]